MTEQPTAITRDSNELRESIIRTCLFLRDRLGYFVGTWGNVSVRVEDGLLVTPSRMSYDAIRAEDLVVAGWEGGIVRGHRVPTSELELHRRILRQRPDIGGAGTQPFSLGVGLCLRRPIDTGAHGRHGRGDRRRGALRSARGGRASS